ncbi:MAG: WD40 repeat domain-containing protein [Spiroplasma sp. WSS]|nr:MAG: WD40 repeat domain-containing protein [Spiroplasma sp. WSS]
MLSINTHVSNNKLIKNCLVNNHETFSKLEGTSGVIQSITSDQKGNVYAANDEGIIYYISENNKDIKPIFKSEGIIQAIATSNNGNVYVAIKETKNETKIYIKNNDSNNFKLLEKFDFNLLSMIVYTSNDGEEYLYMGTDNDVKAYYQSFGQEWLQTIPGTKGKISAIIKDNNNNKCIYAATTDGQIYKTIGGDQKFKELLTTGSKITDLTFDNLGNVYATEMSGQVWKKDNNKNSFFRFQLHPLSNCLTSIVINNDNCIYVGDNTGNLWKSYGSSTFDKLQFKVNISIKKLIFNGATKKMYIGSSNGVYYSD